MFGKLAAHMPQRFFNDFKYQLRLGTQLHMIVIDPRNGQQVLHQVYKPQRIVIYPCNQFIPGFLVKIVRQY